MKTSILIIFSIVLLSSFLSFDLQAQYFNTNGNSGLSGTGTNFIGTTDNVSMLFKTNNSFKMVLDSNGRLGIGLRSPLTQLQLTGSGADQRVAGGDYGNTIRLTDYYVANYGSGGELQFGYGNTGLNTVLSLIKGSYDIWGATSLGGGLHFYTKAANTTLAERLTIKYDGNVGIGTATPSATYGGLDIASGGLCLIMGADANTTARTNATTKYFRMGAYHYTNAEEPYSIASGYTDGTNNVVTFGGGSSLMNAATHLIFNTASNNTTVTGTERMRITNAGKVGIGTTAPSGNIDVVIDGTGAVVRRYAGEPDILFRRANGTISVPTIISAADYVGGFLFQGYDGANYLSTAYIRSYVDGTPGLNDMPGNLSFWTTLDGASTPTERMRIINTGEVGIGTTPNLGYLLHVKSSGYTYGVISEISKTTGNPVALYGITSGATAGTNYGVMGFAINGAINKAIATYAGYPNVGANNWSIYSESQAQSYFAGKVGIGITAPVGQFHIYRDNATTALGQVIIEQDGTGDATLQFGLTSTVNWMIGIDNSVSDNFQISANNDFGTNDFLTIKTTGSVGIGTTAPSSLLHVNSTVSTGTDYLLTLEDDANSATEGIGIKFKESGGTDMGAITCMLYTGKRAIEINPGSALTPIMSVFSDGNVGIGTSSPAAKLDILSTDSSALVVRDGATAADVNFYVKANGYVKARDIQVMTGTFFPDYVFEKDYNLKSISEVEKYITENKHLPDVPSAKEISTSGLNLAEMDATLLKKIEELTLYVIELQKQNEAQQKEIELLKSK